MSRKHWGSTSRIIKIRKKNWLSSHVLRWISGGIPHCFCSFSRASEGTIPSKNGWTHNDYEPLGMILHRFGVRSKVGWAVCQDHLTRLINANGTFAALPSRFLQGEDFSDFSGRRFLRFLLWHPDQTTPSGRRFLRFLLQIQSRRRQNMLRRTLPYSYGHLPVITGYFYGIIHSINGVLLVLITDKWP